MTDTSVDYDRHVKLPLYARAGIAEVWLVNLPQEAIEIYRQPVDNAYSEISLVKRGEALVSRAVANLTLEADSIFG